MAMTDNNDGNGSDRRKRLRILVDLEVDYSDRDNFLFAYIRDISETGIFIHTSTPESKGTHLNLRFMPNDGQKQFLELEGIVIWVNTLRPSNPDNINPGMGIRFTDLAPETRHRLVEYINTFAYLEDPADSNEVDAVSEPSNEIRYDKRTN